MSNENKSGMTFGEEILMAHVAFIAVGVIFSVATWHWLVGWLLRKKVLVTASKAVVALPAAHGVGLDLPRLAVLVAVIAIPIVLGISWVRRYWEREAEKAQ